MNKRLFVQLIGIFLITQILGLAVGTILIGQNVSVSIVNENPNDAINAVALIAYILVFTGILLLIIKFYKGEWLFKILELIVIWGTALIVFSCFFPDLAAICLALLLVLVRITKRKNIWFRNISSIIATAGAGTIIGIALGLIPVILFLVLLSAYDFIAVFKTKHMVTLAKSITQKNLSFTFALPTKEHTFELGTGDMVIPLTFTISVLSITAEKFLFPQTLFAPILILLGSLAGLIWTLDFASKHVGKALPALPLQTAIMIAMLGLSYAIGWI